MNVSQIVGVGTSSAEKASNSELMEDLVEERTLHSVSELKDFVELHYGGFLFRKVKLQQSVRRRLSEF